MFMPALILICLVPDTGKQTVFILTFHLAEAQWQRRGMGHYRRA